MDQLGDLGANAMCGPAILTLKTIVYVMSI